VRGERGGFWILKVTRITPATALTGEQARTEIRKRLIGQSRDRVIKKFMSDLQRKWKNRTTCHSGFVAPDCRGGKSASTTS